MLMYPLPEAAELLSTKLSGAKKNLTEVVEDLEWIREQVTVMEVNFARVHNVSLREWGDGRGGRGQRRCERGGERTQGEDYCRVVPLTPVGRQAPPRPQDD
jgi:hypothetical protein